MESNMPLYNFSTGDMTPYNNMPDEMKWESSDESPTSIRARKKTKLDPSDCPIQKMPKDLLITIMEMLSPYDCTAFAGTSKKIYENLSAVLDRNTSLLKKIIEEVFHRNMRVPASILNALKDDKRQFVNTVTNLKKSVLETKKLKALSTDDTMVEIDEANLQKFENELQMHAKIQIDITLLDIARQKKFRRSLKNCIEKLLVISELNCDKLSEETLKGLSQVGPLFTKLDLEALYVEKDLEESKIKTFKERLKSIFAKFPNIERLILPNALSWFREEIFDAKFKKEILSFCPKIQEIELAEYFYSSDGEYDDCASDSIGFIDVNT